MTSLLRLNMLRIRFFAVAIITALAIALLAAVIAIETLHGTYNCPADAKLPPASSPVLSSD